MKNIAIGFMHRLLTFRYDVKVRGMSEIDRSKASLVMPSHVALVDPMIITAFLANKCHFHPMASRKYYDKWWLKPIFKMIGAIPVEDLEIHDTGGNTRDVKKSIKEVEKKLNKGKSILLYPQGGLASQGYQSIIGKKSAFEVVGSMFEGKSAKEIKEKNQQILVVNIRGLRGSRSSRAWNGKGPSLFVFLVKGGLSLMGNLFVWTPKRKVEIEITDGTDKLRKAVKKGLNDFNSELEKIYNADGEEKIKYISSLSRYNTVKNRKFPDHIDGDMNSLKREFDYSKVKIPQENLEFAIDKIKKIKEDETLNMDLNTNLVLELFFDSLDMAELKMSVQEKFREASNTPLQDLKTVGDVVMMSMGKSPASDSLKECVWKFSVKQTSLYGLLNKPLSGETTMGEDNILAMIQKSFRRLGNQSVCYDQIFGVQGTRDFMIKACVIAEILKGFKEERIGIMLPSLSATSLLVVGCYLSGKVPVMLNWTLSEAGFKHCLEVQKIKTILTAGSFFEKIQTPWLKKYKMTYFEEELKKASVGMKVKGVWSMVRFMMGWQIWNDEVAVVLFTSGSEALPKAVELTHKNIISDIIGALGCIKIRQDDILLAFLPPFHSFGFTVNTILPLITGIRTVNYPDPNDAQTLFNLIKWTKTTLITSTPTFLKRILNMADEEGLKSLRLCLTGAEKAGADLLELMKKKSKKTELLEGYGITECSPVISVANKPGSVGKVIIGGEILIGKEEMVDGKSKWIARNDREEGMILVYGDFVFGGYIDPKLESPFVEVDGKKYYKTGDLGYFDKDGNLQISGRLKRFVKIGGEMVSLPMVEEVLGVSVEAKEDGNGGAEFVAFSTEKMDVKGLNSILHKKGVSNLVKIDRVEVLEEIPVLGTGKTDFMKLREMI